MSMSPNKDPDGFAEVDENEAKSDPYPYIYVNKDGSARELHPEERKYLETRFLPMDGARPYIKETYQQKNGWGDIKGFLRRSKLPVEISTHSAPTENPNKPFTKEQQIQILREKGFDVVENSDRSINARRRS